MSEQDVITGEAPRRYAQALLELAEESKSLKTVEKDLSVLKGVFAENDAVKAVAINPVHATEDKVKALTALADKAGVSALVSQFVGTVAQNHRASEIPSIINVFEELLAQRRGSEIAKITSARKLTAAQLKSIKTELKAALGRDVDTETAVDESLLGGFVVRIGSQLFDSSLKTKIADLKTALKQA